MTPLLAMACELSAAKRPFSFYYAGRSRGELAFLGDIERLASAGATSTPTTKPVGFSISRA